MQIAKLLFDASGMPAGTSMRRQSQALAERLGDIKAASIMKWLERRSISSERLRQIAKVCQLDPRNYGFKARRSTVYK